MTENPRQTDDDDDDVDHWISLDEAMRRALEKAEKAFQQKRSNEDDPS